MCVTKPPRSTVHHPLPSIVHRTSQLASTIHSNSTQVPSNNTHASPDCLLWWVSPAEGAAVLFGNKFPVSDWTLVCNLPTRCSLKLNPPSFKRKSQKYYFHASSITTNAGKLYTCIWLLTGTLYHCIYICVNTSINYTSCFCFISASFINLNYQY